ncbi:MAG: gliding motility-associated C-terminal domain-containing protein [Saprospiraceae bacterium]
MKLTFVIIIIILNSFSQLMYAEGPIPAGSNYSVSVSTGSVTPGVGNYDMTTSFQLQPGSAGNGNVTLTVTDNAAPFCNFDFEIEDPGTCSMNPVCPAGIDTTYLICPYWEATNNFLLFNGLPSGGVWEPPLQMWGGTVYNSCTDAASVYIFPHEYPGCPVVYDTAHFEFFWNPCGWQPDNLCYDDSIHFTMPNFPGFYSYSGDSSYTLWVSGEPPSYVYALTDIFYADSTYDITVPIPSEYDPGGTDGCFQIAVTTNGCTWMFGVLFAFDFTCVSGIIGSIPPCNNLCADPPNAGNNNSISICDDDPPFDLTTILGGNPDPGGNWSPPLSSGGNIYNPAIDGSGTFTYTVSASGCPDDNASVTVNALSSSIVFSGIPSSLCELSSPIILPTNQSGVNGNWSGPGVSNNMLDPDGLTGIITLIFTPDANQCAEITTADIIIDAAILIVVTSVPDSLCQTETAVPLPTSQNGINGNWSGPGVSNNIFNASGLSGNITITFTPDAGQCAYTATSMIAVELALTLVIIGVPDSLCQSDTPVSLSTIQDGFNGNWSGNGVVNNIFSPAGLTGNIPILFTPDIGQCANVATVNIFIDAIVIPVITGVPFTLCQTESSITLPTIQDGITGNWSGPGVAINTFDPAGLNGSIQLVFSPDVGQCADVNTTSIEVTPMSIPVIVGVPDSVCEITAPIFLPTDQSGIQGNWSGPGVTFNTFNPAGQGGDITLMFSPNAGQCADPATVDILVKIAFTPLINGIPASLCQTSFPIVLPVDQNGIIGNWSGSGVNNNLFNPSGLNGNILLTFSPDAYECANNTSTLITVEPAITPLITGIPDSLCQTQSSVQLAGTQNGISGTWAGPGITNNIFNPSGLNGNISLIFTPLTGQCANVAFTSITIIDSFIPVISGIPTSICETASPVLLSVIQNNISGNWSGTGISSNIFNPSGLMGAHTLTFLPNANQCAAAATASVVINNAPSFSNLTASCDSISQTYTVTFEITSGAPGSYTVDGTPVGGTSFISSPFDADSTEYTFLIDDVNGCGPVDVTGYINCACATYAGTMNFTGSPLNICDGDIISALHNSDQNLDSDDVLGFVLHDNAGTQLGTIYVIADQPTFSIPTGIVFGQTYYLSSVAGSNNGTGAIDLSDACLSVSQGVPIIFYQTVEIDLTATLCSGETLEVNGSEYNESNPAGTEVFTQGNVNGCDSIVNVALSFYQPVVSDVNYTLCSGESVIINGIEYNQSNSTGTEIINGGSANGCDSIINVQLTFYPTTVFDLNQTLCYGGSITVNGTAYNELNATGTETFVNASAFGCDSIVNINLSFDSIVTNNLDAQLCNGESLVVKGVLYDEFNPSGSEVFVGGSVFGCDSIVNIALSFYQPVVSDVIYTLCSGESVIINGMEYNQSKPTGKEVIIGGSAIGCDSIVSVQLSFYSPAAFNLNQILCYGGSITVNGTAYNELNPTGTETFVNASAFGCDSIVNINLSFNSIVTNNMDAQLCSDESILVNNVIYNALNPSGSQLFPGGSIFGCDSVVNISLSFFPLSQSELHPVLCYGESVTINGMIYNAQHPSGIESVEGAGYHGCDSIISIEIIQVPSLVVEAGPDQHLQPGEQVLLSAVATFPIVSWSWSPGDFLSCSNCPDPMVINPDHDILYQLTVSDAEGCTASDEIQVYLANTVEIFMPTIFSPNGDGINDVVVVFSTNTINKIKSLRIFSRWGDLIYEQENFPSNDLTYGWDGTFNGKELNPGVYIWAVEVELKDLSFKNYSGDITLIR